MDRADFLALLTERGIPHDASVRDLLARHGGSRATYYDWDVVRLHDARPLVEGQVEPPDFIPRLLPDLLPPPQLSAFVALDPDARTNHARAVEILTRRLGEPVEASTSNTLGHRWAFGTAVLSIVSWPPELPPNASLTNPAWERHPEMRAFAFLGFGAGHLVPLDDRESQWIASARPLELAADVIVVSPPSLSSDAWRGDSSFRRLPPSVATRESFVGWSRDSEAFVGTGGESAFVVRREDLVGFDLNRSSGARSAAATLALRYRDPCSSSRLERTKYVLTGRQTASLDTLAQLVADRAERPLEIFDQPYD
jgi:hypothetical protein